jgi:hypothetical protein
MFQYNKYTFCLKFEKEIAFRSPASFIFRNNIGFQLKKLTCILKSSRCGSCILDKTCIYSSVFETPIDKNNGIIKGRDRGSHPYLVYSDAVTGVKVGRINLDIILIGNAVNYFPYILLTMINIGKSGILSGRIHFSIENVSCQGESVLTKENDYCKNISPLIWDWDGSALAENKNERIKEVELAFLSPLRIKHNGRYVSNLTYKDILYGAARRIDILDNFFGDGSSANHAPLADLPGFIEGASNGKEFFSRLKWADYSRYSARQKQSMRMGGLTGKAVVKGVFSSWELALLEAAGLFHIGKNASFGLGKMEVRANG